MGNLISRILTVSCLVACVGLTAASCGSESNNGAQCGDDQTFATVNGVEKCYDNCADGLCDAGFACNQGLCVATGATNNGATNNGATNNGATNNGTTNNGTTNNGTTNNGVVTNNGTGCQELDPALGPCDPLCQTGCGANEGCVVGATGPGAPIMSACGPAGAGMADAACDQENPCAPGFGCLTTDGTNFTCRQFCSTGTDDAPCSGAAECSPFDQNEQRIGVCVVPDDECTGYPNDSCPDGQNCYLTNLGKRCVAHGNGMPGDACASPTDCGDEQGCIGDGTTNNCRAFCDPNAAMCDAGEQCAQLQGETFGVCVPPQ